MGGAGEKRGARTAVARPGDANRNAKDGPDATTGAKTDAIPDSTARRRGRSDSRTGGARWVGSLWRAVGRARFSVLGVVGVVMALVTLGGALALVTQPGAPGPLVISAPTTTPAPFFPATPTLGGFPTDVAATQQGAGFGDTTPNAPIVATTGAGAPTLCPPSSAPTTTAQTPTTAPTRCTPCGVYLGGNPDHGQIRSALATAANVYRLPHNLLFAVAWAESSWHNDIISCSGGVGLMQMQADAYSWLNQQRVPACQIGATSYDPFTLEGNADLGAKYLKYLNCFYSYWGADPHAILSAPSPHTAAWYYQQAARRYPDTLDAKGAPNATSLCAAVFHADTTYAALPATLTDPWSCPFSAQANDYTLLDLTLSAYNQGAGATDQNGVQNLTYVRAVEGYIPSFASGALGM